jgi:hypothetical protein
MTAYMTVAIAVDPNFTAARSYFVGAQSSVSVAVELGILVSEAFAADALEEVGATVIVEIVVAGCGFHHVVAVLYGPAIIATARIGEHESAVLASLMAGALVQVDAVAVGAAPAAEPMASLSPEMLAAAHSDVFTGLMVLALRRSKAATHLHHLLLLLHSEIIEGVHLHHRLLCSVHSAYCHIP